MSDSSIDVSEDTFDAAVLKDERPVLPTLLLFKGGEVVASKEGVPSRSQLSEFLDARLQATAPVARPPVHSNLSQHPQRSPHGR